MSLIGKIELQRKLHYFPEPREGAVGGVPEPFEIVEPLAASFQNLRGSAATGEGGEIQIGNITLQVVSGDITRETTDAIVNGTNPTLDLTQGKFVSSLLIAMIHSWYCIKID